MEQLTKKHTHKLIQVMKILAIMLMVVYFFRLFSVDFFEKYLSNASQVIANPFFRGAYLCLRWGTQGVLLTVLIGTFFDNRSYHFIIRWIAPIFVLLNLMCFRSNTIAFIGPEAFGKVGFLQWRSLEFIIELLLIGAIVVIDWIAYYKQKERFQNPKKIVLAVLLFIGLCLLVTPAFTFYGMFGMAGPEGKGFTFAHRILIYLCFGIPMVLYFYLRNRSYEDRYLILLTIAIAGFICYFYPFEFSSFKNVSAWPLHLCNTAIILMAIAFVFRSKTFFYFNYFINVLGALCAILMPNTSVGIFQNAALHFWFNHMYAFFLPILGVALKIFPRPKFKMIMSSILVFTIYFVTVAFVNAWFYNYDTSVNYFFLNDEFLVEKFGFLKEIRKNYLWTFQINGLHFTIYYLYWFIIYLGFIGLTFATWFVYDFLYKVSDSHYDLMVRKKRKKLELLELQQQQKQEDSPESLQQRGYMIEIKNFSKRYEGSKRYSVKDFNLTIQDGEIFGFVGHNGAGKSTLIKCLVGIQGITEGSISIGGFDIRKEPLKAKLLVGYVPDNHAVYEKLTGREYVNYIADLFLVSTGDRQERLNKYVNMFELEEAIDRQIKSYSHGMKQKITVIAALIHNPKIWVLDEPLIGLDPTSSYQIKECMKQHAKAGNIVFFSSHVMEVVENICHRVAIISGGHLEGVYTVHELKEKHLSLEQLYLESIENKQKNMGETNVQPD